MVLSTAHTITTLWHRQKTYTSAVCDFLAYLLHYGIGTKLPHCNLNDFPKCAFTFSAEY